MALKHYRLLLALLLEHAGEAQREEIVVQERLWSQSGLFAALAHEVQSFKGQVAKKQFNASVCVCVCVCVFSDVLISKSMSFSCDNRLYQYSQL